jgi:hypothetical protein
MTVQRKVILLEHQAKFGLMQVGPPRSSFCSELTSAFGGGIADMADLFVG